MEQCIGIISIINNSPKETTAAINECISEYRKIVVGRLGIPKHEPDIGIIALIVEGETNKIQALEENLNKINGLTVNLTMTVCKV